jgi:hypothetical protein
VFILFFEENAKPDIESGVFGDDKTYIGLYHAALLNAKTDIGYEIDHCVLVRDFDGFMLGDIHKDNHSTIKVLFHPSSLIQQNFGENISGHGF